MLDRQIVIDYIQYPNIHQYPRIDVSGPPSSLGIQTQPPLEWLQDHVATMANPLRHLPVRISCHAYWPAFLLEIRKVNGKLEHV